MAQRNQIERATSWTRELKRAAKGCAQRGIDALAAGSYLAPASRKSVAEQYDAMAKAYDFYSERRIDLGFFREHLSCRRKRALDVGCGSGIVAWELARHYDQVVGIDLSQGMIDLAGQKRSRANIEYCLMDARALVFDEPFDLVVSRNTLHMLENLPAFLERTRSLLCRHGKLVILDVARPQRGWSTAAYVEAAVKRFPADARRHGAVDAVLMLRHCLGRDWLASLAATQTSSPSLAADAYAAILPGSTILRRKNGLELAVVWQKP